MKVLAKNWKAILALLLVIAAALIYFLVYRNQQAVFESSESMLQMQITAMQNGILENRDSIKENMKYEAVQAQLEEETEKLQTSRTHLYEHFPAELREEDQILYILYLEQLFGNEITFEFAREPMPLGSLEDGSMLSVYTIVVNYEAASYDAFLKLVEYLSTDAQIASVANATMIYDENSGAIQGHFVIFRYALTPSDYDSSTYQAPDVDTGNSIGKQNIFH